MKLYRHPDRWILKISLNFEPVDEDNNSQSTDEGKSVFDHITRNNWTLRLDCEVLLILIASVLSIKSNCETCLPGPQPQCILMYVGDYYKPASEMNDDVI